MQLHGYKKYLKGLIGAVLVFGVLFIGLVIYRIPAVIEQEKTAESVRYINEQILTLEDVTGEKLPPKPDPVLADAMIEGIDVNENGIRDDVELAIFERYPGEANIKIRAAMLQYAMGMQLELTKVFNSETWKVAVQQSGRGYGCLFETSPEVTLSDSEEIIQQAFAVGRARIQEVEDLVLNTKPRRDFDSALQQYATSFGGVEGKVCDITL